MLSIMYDRRGETFNLGIWNDVSKDYAVWLTKSIPTGPIARKAFGDHIIDQCLENPGKVLKVKAILAEQTLNNGIIDHELDRTA